MNAVKLTTLGMALSICLCTAHTGFSQGANVTLKLTAYQQATTDVEVKTDVYKSTTKTIKITTKTILDIIAAEEGVAFPSGAVLFFDPENNKFEVRSSAGATLLDVSDYFDFADGAYIYSGTWKDMESGSGKETTYQSLMIKFTSTNYTCELYAMLKGSYSEKWKTSDGTTTGKITQSGKGNCVGYGDKWGTVTDPEVVITGTLSYKGKETYTD